MGPANAFFLYPSSFPFLLPQSLWGRKSVALGGDSACNQRAGKSLSFGLNTPLSPSLSLSASALARLKSYCLYGRDFRKGAHRSPSQSSLFCLLVLCFLFPDWVRLTGEGFVQGSLTSPISTKTQNMFSSHTHVIQMTTNVAEYNTSNITDTFLLAILKAIFQNVPFFQNCC